MTRPVTVITLHPTPLDIWQSLRLAHIVLLTCALFAVVGGDPARGFVWFLVALFLWADPDPDGPKIVPHCDRKDNRP